MTVKECYDMMGEDYQEIFSRLRKEDFISKLLLHFLADPNFQQLCESMDNNDYEKAFHHVHTLKGACLNLGLTSLGGATGEVTECLRTKDIEGAERALPAVKEAYAKIKEAICKLQEKSGHEEKSVDCR